VGGGQGEGSKVKATKTSGGWNASPSYNPPRDCNISSFVFVDNNEVMFLLNDRLRLQ